MTREETKKLLNLIGSTYNNCFKTYDKEQKQLLIESWYAVMYRYDQKDVFRALQNYVEVHTTQPKIAHIKEELNILQAQRHSSYKRVQDETRLDSTAKLTRQNLIELVRREFYPQMCMNMPEELKQQLNQQNSHESVEKFASAVWSLVMSVDLQVYHVEMALGTLRGTKFTFKQFMKTLIENYEFAEKLMEAPNKLQACKENILKELKVA
ncbi:replicative helicase loader/inhibitor [Francisella philomiragia]|uniref:Loader and inhibitor of phage G40P family protein n=1 Tax=Francisella philomiragia TaxID=28110 RepID=A0A0B6CS84_9GAMM|nr:replicative helicase loader/inhibitor [Francisella philomiragia]AJI53339.1 loader and inhibitor of phage G40P family protein [Francisella philomiragia]